MEETTKRKQDLEDEMNRFEQEISSNLPPPPKVGKISPPNPSVLGAPPPPPPFIGMPGMGKNMPFPGPPPMPPQMFGVPGIEGMPPMPPGMPVPPGLPPMMVPPPMLHMMAGRPGFNKIIPPTVPMKNYDGSISSLPDFSMIKPDIFKTGAGESSKKKDKKKSFVRVAGGTVWEDGTLMEWDSNDFRLFVGDLGNEVSDDALLRAFSRYPSLLKAKVIRDKKTKKTKGFGFVSFKDPQDYLKAMREMNGKYVGNRPIKLRKSTWKERNIGNAKKKEKEKKKLGLR